MGKLYVWGFGREECVRSHPALYTPIGPLDSVVEEILPLLILELSVSPGERVALMTPNVHQAMEAHYAITGGCRAVVLNLNQR